MSSFKAMRSASGRRRVEDAPSVRFDDDVEDLPPLLKSLRLGHHDRAFNKEFQEDLGKHIDRLPPSPHAAARHKALSRFRSIAERARKEYNFASNPVGPILTLSHTEAKPFREFLRHTRPAERDMHVLEVLDQELGLLPQFRQMPREQRLAVYQHIRYMAVNNRHIVARKGEADRWFILVLSGTLQVRPLQDSMEAVFTLWPGQHFQEHVLTTGQVKNTLNTLRALSDCELAVIECSDANAVMGAHWAMHVHIGGFPWDQLDKVRQFLATDPKHRRESDLLRVGALMTRLEWFRRLPPMVQCHVCKFMRSVTLDPGSTLFARGGADDSLYVLLSGRLQRADMAANLDEKTVREKRGGSTFKVHRSKSIVNAFVGIGAHRRDQHPESTPGEDASMAGGTSGKDVDKSSKAALQGSTAHVAANVHAAEWRSTVSILDGGTRSHKPGALEKEAAEREVGEHALLPGWVYGDHILAAEATGPAGAAHHRSKHLWTAIALEECEILVLDRATYTQVSTKYHAMHASNPGLAASAQVLYQPPEERTHIHVQYVVDQLQKSVPIMSRLPDAALVDAVSHMQYRLMLTDEHIALTPEDNKLYLVLDGHVHVVLKMDEQGAATDTARIRPGQCLGGLVENAQDGVVHAHSAKCMELTELAVLDGEWTERFLLSELRLAMRDQFLALRAAPLLSGVEDLLLHRAAPHCITRTLHAGTALAHAAARSDRLHFILQGQVLILLPRMPPPNEPKTKMKKQRKDHHPQASAPSANKAGGVHGLPASRSPHAVQAKSLYKPAAHGTIQLGVLGEHECFGDVSVVLGKDERETFVAASKVVTMSMTKVQFNEVFGKYHDMMKNIRRSAHARMQYHEARTEKLLAFAGHQKTPPGLAQMGENGRARERDFDHDSSRPATRAVSAQPPKPVRTGGAIPLTASLFRRLTPDVEHTHEVPDEMTGDTVRLVAQSIYPLDPTRSLAGHQSRRPALRSISISPPKKHHPTQDRTDAATQKADLETLRPGSRDSAYSLGRVSRASSRQRLRIANSRALPSSRGTRALRPTSTPASNLHHPREAPSSPSEPVGQDGALLGGLLEYMGRMGTGRQGSGGGGSKPVTPSTPQRSSSAGLTAAAQGESTALVDRTHFRSPVLVIPTKDIEDPGAPKVPHVGRADIISNIMDMCLHHPSTRPAPVGAFAPAQPHIDQSPEPQARWIDQGGRLDVPPLDLVKKMDAQATDPGPSTALATSRTVHFSDREALPCTDLDPVHEFDTQAVSEVTSYKGSPFSNQESEHGPLDHDSLNEGFEAASTRSSSSSMPPEDGGSTCCDAMAGSLQPEPSRESFNSQKIASGRLSPTTCQEDAALNQALPSEVLPSHELFDKTWSPPESLKHMFLAVPSSEGIETQGPTYSTTLRRQNSLSGAPDRPLTGMDKGLDGAVPGAGKNDCENETHGRLLVAGRQETSAVGMRGKFALQSSPPVSPRSWKASGYAPTVSQFEPKIQNVDLGPDVRWSLDAARPKTSPAGSALTQSLDSRIASKPTRNATARVRVSGSRLHSSTLEMAMGGVATEKGSNPKKYTTSARSGCRNRIRPYDYVSLSEQQGHLCTNVIKDNSNAAKRMTQSGLNALVGNTTDNLLRAFRDFGKTHKPKPISLYDQTKSNSMQKAEWEKTLELVVRMIPEEIGVQPEPEDPGLVCTSEFFDAYRSRHFLDLMQHIDLLSISDTGVSYTQATVSGQRTSQPEKLKHCTSQKHLQPIDIPTCDARDDIRSPCNGVRRSLSGNWSAEEEFNWNLDRPMSAMYTPKALKQADYAGQQKMTSANSSVERGVSDWSGRISPLSGSANHAVPPVTLFCSCPVAYHK